MWFAPEKPILLGIFETQGRDSRTMCRWLERKSETGCPMGAVCDDDKDPQAAACAANYFNIWRHSVSARKAEKRGDSTVIRSARKP